MFNHIEGMNYPPREFQETGFQNIIKIIRAYPLATLISVHNNKLYTSHIPLIYYKDKQFPFGKLAGHIDIHNPQLNALQKGTAVSIIFHGPDSYISPSLFKADHLPTWNYIKVHIEGKPREIKSKDTLRQSLLKMTESLEANTSGYMLSENHPTMNKLLDYIVGFEIEITSWEGKFKLSQNKPTEEQDMAIQSMTVENKKDISALVKSILKDFQRSS